MKYIIIELQTTNGTMALDSTVKSTYETAEQEYHRRLMYAAVSSVHLHAVTILGENGNAAPLMWEWVFDVVGYYFLGTVTTRDLLLMIGFQYIMKLIIEAFLGTPMAYGAIALLKRLKI